jgi:hypothetical protein
MSSSIKRAKPADIPTTLKEAVVDALLNLAHERLTGAGERGRILFGARPRALLASGFLMSPDPKRLGIPGDEVTDPIRICGHGLDLQVAQGVAGQITAQPHLSIYVRVLPNETDLLRPDCVPNLRLKNETVKRLRSERRAALEELWKAEAARLGISKKKDHPNWRAEVERVRREIYERNGIPLDITTVFSTEDSGDDGSAEEGAPEAIPLPAGGARPAIRDEDFEPMDVPHKWMRLDVQVPPLTIEPNQGPEVIGAAVAASSARLNDAIAKAISDWASSDDPSSGGKRWAYKRGLAMPPSQWRDWNTFLAMARASQNELALPAIVLDWEVSCVPDWLDPTRANLHISLENKSREPRQFKDATDEAVFVVSLDITLPAHLHRPLKLERVEPSYRYNEYLRYAAMGYNGGVAQVRDAPANHVLLRTTWAPRFTQPRILPRTYLGITPMIRQLAQPDGLKSVKPLVAAMREWLEDVRQTVNPAEGIDPADTLAIAIEQDRFKGDSDRWDAEIKSVETGFEILLESKAAWLKRGPQADERARIYEAWLAMNEAMANLMRERLQIDDGEWRLFQLAFIVASVPALATRLDCFKNYYDRNRDDTVTLLYFATGGGKSEAFFGLLLLALFLDRLRGKTLGVTAMLRYPLRLLTIQQAQRCAKVLAQAELVKRKQGYDGEPFVLGFWVGNGGTPNRLSEPGVTSVPFLEDVSPDLAMETAERKKRGYDTAVKAWNKIPACPFCGSRTTLRRIKSRGGLLAHVCSSSKCPANEGGWTALPFLICDEDIYECPPAVLLGTVDKLALIGNYPTTIRRVFGMFGLAPWRDTTTGRLRVPSTSKQWEGGPAAAGCEPLFPFYRGGKRLFFDPFPALLIQDEAHLLDESLGTFAGLFESTLDAVFEDLSVPLGDLVVREPDGKTRRRAKVIAASATVNDPERQLEHLYQRQVPAIQFPHPGPSLYTSFYAAPQEPDPKEVTRAADPNVETRARWGRVYAGFITNGKPHTATSIMVLSNFHAVITTLFTGLLGDTAAQARARATIESALSSGPHVALYRAAVGVGTPEQLATLIDLHRIALTYVTNKKGGDQIMAAEFEETRKRHQNEGLPLEDLKTKLITGSVEQGEIQEVVRLAQYRPDPGQDFETLDSVVRSVIATSAISHGVDVEELNSMFFAGMPSDIAEYIQASSRVGRTHVGFIVLIPTPQRRRDRYIVEVFDSFHRFLERMVQPAAIDRWAEKAVARVFPSLFQAYVCGIRPTRAFIVADEDKKHLVSDYSWIPDITRDYIHEVRGPALVNSITSFVERAVGLKQGFYPQGEEHYRRVIEDKARRLLQNWASSPLAGQQSVPDYFKQTQSVLERPMMSLRDVDEPGVIHMTGKDVNGQWVSNQQVRDVMEFLRRGISDDDDMGA